MFGQQNPFGLGPMGSGQQSNNLPNVPNPSSSALQTTLSSSSHGQGQIFSQSSGARLASGEPMSRSSSAADQTGTFRSFGQPASFTPSSVLMQFGTGSAPSTGAPIFGASFQSPTLPTSSGLSTTTPSFTFATSKPNQGGEPMLGFGQLPWLPAAPVFPAGVSRSSGFPATEPSTSRGPVAGNLFGQRFGNNAPTTNIFGNSSKTSVVPAVPEVPQSQSTLLALHDSTAEPESAVMKSLSSPKKQENLEDHSRSRHITDPPTPDSGRRVVVNRKAQLFTRALAGVNKAERMGRARLPSREEKPKDPRARRLSERRGSVTDLGSLEKTRSSPQEILQLTSIMCKGIPDHLNNKDALLQHFGKFGVVSKIFCNVPKNSAYIYFKDHDAAAKAKASGTILEPDIQPMLILWTKSTASTRTRSDILSRAAKSPTSTNLYTDPAEVNKELASMGQSQYFEPPKLLERPKGGPKTRHTKHSPGEASEMQKQEAIQLHNNSPEERYRALENRDKLLRQGIKKQSNLATARATIGSCPDMCSEKERYMREHRNQLHPFEITSDSDNKNPVVDHRKVVKEYSRSSADQEEPLPHELRPANVLSMTMDYLVCNIMDLHEQGRSSAEEWYDFVWNRTRAIRKDITQQHLSDHIAVALVEKCARFHIHCAERLCEEDMSAFDQKINNENLTNCLQTLKYAYADMQARGERCASESEFRAYEVLLNLNEGDILRQVQLLAPEVRESSQVLQALSFYVALNANNYVRFFKLVRSTSYLNACIVQRYFTQVRLKALYAIVRAYSPANHPGLFPLSKMTEILAFEDESDARDFLMHYGLVMDGPGVVLDRSSLSQPENPVTLRRSLRIIESKRQCLVGEVINDGPLPRNPLVYHVPHSSFDGQSTVNREPEDVAQEPEIYQQLDESTASQVQAEALLAARIEEEQKAIAINEASLAVMDSVINDVVVDAIMHVRADMLRLYEFEHRHTLDTCSAIMQSVCPQLIRQIAEQILSSEKLEELKARKRREEAELARQEHIRQFIAKCSVEVWENALLDVVEDKAQELATRELNAAKEIARQLSIERSCEQLSQEYWQEHAAASLYRICDGLYAEMMEFRTKTLNRVAEKLGVWRSIAAIRKWRNLVAKRKRTRRSMETFPSCNLRPISKPQAGDKLMRVVSPLQIVQNRKYLDRKLEVGVLTCRIREAFSHRWIDALSLVKEHVAFAPELVSAQRRLGTTLRNLYWSITFSFPLASKCDTGPMSALIGWLKSKFSQPESHPGSNTTKADVLNTVIHENHRNFTTPYSTAVCIKGFQGCLPDTEASALVLRGTQALVFVLQIPKSDSIHSDQFQKFWDDEWQRLTTILRCKPKNPAVPLLILAVGQENEPLNTEHVAEGLRIDLLRADNYISTFTVVFFANSLDEPSSTQALTRSLQWAAQNCPRPPNLRIARLNELMNKVVVECYSSLVYKDLAKERRHQPPNVLIDAYNHAVAHAASTVSDQALMDVSWPQSEFTGNHSDLPKPNWNTAATLQMLKDKVLLYQLPPFCSNVQNCADLAGLRQCICGYVSCLQYAHWDKVILASRIDAIFEESKVRQCMPVLPHECIAWTNIVDVFIDFNLQMSIDLQAVYDNDKIESFVQSEGWCRATLWRSEPVSIPKRPFPPLPRVKRKTEPDDYFSPKQKLTKDPFESPSKSEMLRQSFTELKRQLDIEKQRSMNYEAFLLRTLEEGKI